MRAVLLLALLCWLVGCRAEPQPAPGELALQRHGQALTADGFPPAAVWRQADSFALADLHGGGAARQAPTLLALTYVEGRLCLRARCDDADAEHLVYASRLRDATELWRDDSLELWLAIGDEAARFVVNPGGALLDERIRGGKADADWDADASVRCTIDADGWTAELAIPLAGLVPAAAPAGPLTLRANLLRVRQGREGAFAEESSWRPAAGGSWHDAGALATIRLPVDAATLAGESRLLPPRLPDGLRAGAPPAQGEAILRALYRTTVALRPLAGPGSAADPTSDPAPLRLRPQNPAVPMAPEPATVQLVAGAEALHLRIDCADRDPAAIASGVGVPIGELWRQDCVEILLSPERKASGFWQLIVTPSGRWSLLRERRPLPGDGIEVQAAVGADGWQATLRIPYAVFGLARGRLPALWGFNVTRNRPMRADAPQQATCWAPLDQDLLGLLWLAGADRHPDLATPAIAAAPPAEAEAAPADPAFTVLSPDECRELQPGASPLRRYAAVRDELFAARDARLATIASWAEVEALQEELRDGFRRSLGGLPERTPLAPRSELVCERDGLRIERVVYHSRPGFPVTANLFLPLVRSGPLPAVFRLQGHSMPGRLATRDIAINVELAGLGYAVFAIDLPGQGERILVRNGNGLRSPTDNHYAEGTACQLTGGNLAAHMVWDVMRGVDYLATRSEVDAQRIVLTGSSGGGTMSGYVAALEPRIAAVAPVSALNSGRGQQGNYDAEQVLFAGVQRWLDVQGFAIMAAPRPFLVITEASDASEAQTRADFAAVRRLYDLRQAGGRLGYHPTRAPHGLGGEHYRPFKAWLLATVPPDPRPAPAAGGRAPSREELRCTSTGSVYHAPEFAGAVSVLGLNQGRIGSDGSLPGRLAGLLGLEAADAAPSTAEPRGAAQWQGLAVERLLLSGEPGIPLPAVLLSAAAAPPRAPAVVLVGDRGKAATAAARSREIAALCQAGIRVLLVDLRGTGETAASSDYGYRDSGESELAGFGLRLGRPLIGRRVRDLQACIDHLRRRPDVDAERIALWGDSLARPNDPAVRQWRVLPEERGVEAQAQAESVSPLAALYATVLDPRLAGCVGVGMLKGFAGLCATPYAQHPYALCTPGILQHGDLPDLLRACAPRPLLLVAPVDALNRASARGASPLFPDSDSAAYAAAVAAAHCRVVEADGGELVPFLRAVLRR